MQKYQKTKIWDERKNCALFIQAGMKQVFWSQWVKDQIENVLSLPTYVCECELYWKQMKESGMLNKVKAALFAVVVDI